jgi:chromosome segregation ATPase
MRKSSEGNILDERFEHALGVVRNILDEHEISCAERGRVAEEAAQADISRFAEVSGELAQARRELSALEEERAALPLAAYKAGLDGDLGRESELRERYASIAPEDLEALRDRCVALEAEAEALGGTASDAEKRAHTSARDAYTEVLRDLEQFEERIDGLKSAVGELRSKYWNCQRRVDEHLNLLREIGRDERRQAKGEAARRATETGRAAASFPGRR